ncbi:MAG TPA: helix-turn-helix domain-containing protein [Candidatus Limnocylindrales bacterium]|nr:helix-turn-helix domain-containing protein [Candidatus Limnocylindrales bacterium]
MRPVSVYAKVSEADYHQVVSALHHQWRIATRIMMVLLSVNGWTPTDIAALLHYDPKTVRRWIQRHSLEGLPGLPDRPRSGRPRIGGTRLAERIAALLAKPKAWTTVRMWAALGKPAVSLRTVYRRIREQATWRRPRLVAKGDPDHDTICADVRQQIAALPAGSVVLAEDETHLDLLAKLRACWIPQRRASPDPHPGQQQATHCLRRGQPPYRAMALPSGRQGRLSGVLLLPGHGRSGLPRRARDRGHL